jgi:hypothetical protein
MSAHRPAPTPHLSSSDVLRLVLATCCAMTLTPWGATMAVVVLVVLAARWRARSALERSAAVRRGVLTPAKRGRLLHPAGHRRKAMARP